MSDRVIPEPDKYKTTNWRRYNQSMNARKRPRKSSLDSYRFCENSIQLILGGHMDTSEIQFPLIDSSTYSKNNSNGTELIFSSLFITEKRISI